MNVWQGPLPAIAEDVEGMVMKILLVDDEPVFRTYIRQMALWASGEFKLAGEAGSSDEALSFLERQGVDIVITDVSMPGKNGVVLSELVARLYPHTAIVAVSSYDDYDYVRELLKNGAYDYILKSRLSEELLLLTLKNIRTRLSGRSLWEVKRELRRQAGEWLWGDGVNPFTSDNSRMVATVITVRCEGAEPLLQGDGILEGVGKIAEAVSNDNMDILACPRDPDHIVLLTRFYDLVSEAEMRSRLECSRVVVQDSVLRIYNLRLRVFLCPFFFNDVSLRSFLLHKLEEPQEPAPAEAALSLSLGQYRRLLSVAEEHNPDLAPPLVREIYGEIPVDHDGRCLMVTKELLEIIRRIADEYRIGLDFLPGEFMLFQYARMKSRDTLVANIAGLYQNVLREIRELEKKENGYSETVNRAIAYQREHYHEPISLRAVADSIGVSSSYLSRIFHEETNQTVTDYLRNIRMEKAKRLMDDKVPLKDIVYRCGFRNYGYFLKTFKEHTGTTPKEYGSGRK